MHTLEGISEIHYINLDRRSDRADHIKRTLPFSSSRFSAIDGSTLTLTPDLKKLFPSGWDKLSKGEIACALSHYHLWKKLTTDSPALNYLILEDDVVFEEGFAEKWNTTFSKDLPDDYSLIYLGGCQPWNQSIYPEVLSSVSPSFANIKSNDHFTPKDHYWHMTTSSYIISKQAASILCQWVEQRGFCIDTPLALDIFLLKFFDSNPLFKAPQSVYHLTPLMAYQLHEEGGNCEVDAKSDIRNDQERFSTDYKIFIIGPNRCGTSSLNKVFEDAGVACRHYGDGKIAEAMFTNFSIGLPLLHNIKPSSRFYSDMEKVYEPTAPFALYGYLLFKDLYYQYPDAKFVLNMRPKEDWLKSRIRHGNGDYLRHFMRTLKLDNPHEAVKMFDDHFESHLSHVQDFFQDKPGKLLLFDIMNDGIAELAEFFPDIDFSNSKWRQLNVGPQ